MWWDYWVEGFKQGIVAHFLLVVGQKVMIVQMDTATHLLFVMGQQVMSLLLSKKGTATHILLVM